MTDANPTMDENNPYNAPDAALITSQQELYEPTIFSFNGRLGRLRYLAYGIGVNFALMAVLIPLAAVMGVMGGSPDGMSVVGMLIIGIFYIATTVISVMFGKRRLNDLNRSGWWFLLFFVPLVNLILAIYVLFFPGTDGPNNYGPPPVANSTGVLILGWLFPAIFLIGMLAAIVIPMMAGF